MPARMVNGFWRQLPMEMEAILLFTCATRRENGGNSQNLKMESNTPCLAAITHFTCFRSKTRQKEKFYAWARARRSLPKRLLWLLNRRESSRSLHPQTQVFMWLICKGAPLTLSI